MDHKEHFYQLCPVAKEGCLGSRVEGGIAPRVLGRILEGRASMQSQHASMQALNQVSRAAGTQREPPIHSLSRALQVLLGGAQGCVSRSDDGFKLPLHFWRGTLNVTPSPQQDF